MSAKGSSPTGAENIGGGTAGLSKLPKLPPVQPTTEYSTLRFSKQQPSSRWKSWDTRKAATGIDLTRTAHNADTSPSAPSSARELNLTSPRALKLSSTFDKTLPLPGYPPKTARLGREPPTTSTLIGLTTATPRRKVESELFSIDQEELTGFRLGSISSSSTQGPGPGGGSGRPPGPDLHGDDEGQNKQVDQTPAHLLHIRQMYTSKDRKSPIGKGKESADLGIEGGTDEHLQSTGPESATDGDGNRQLDANPRTGSRGSNASVMAAEEECILEIAGQ